MALKFHEWFLPIRQNEPEELRTLLEGHREHIVNWRGDTGKTALSFVEEYQSWACGVALVQAGVHPDAVLKGRPLLTHVAGDIDQVKCLLEAGAGPNLRDEDGQTPLMSAVSCEECVQALLEAGANPNGCCKKGTSPLMAAIVHPDTLRILRWDMDGVCPNDAAVRLLLEAGAEWDACNKDGVSPFSLAANVRDVECARILAEASHNDVVMDHVSTYQHDRVDFWWVELLIKAGVDPGTMLFDSPLLVHVACHAELVRCLLDAGADPSARVSVDDDFDIPKEHQLGETALFKACESGAEDSVALLLAAGADVDAFCSDANQFSWRTKGRTPLMHLCSAVVGPHVVCFMQRLFEAGADLDVQHPYIGATALEIAVQADRAECVRFLLSVGARPMEWEEDEKPDRDSAVYQELLRGEQLQKDRSVVVAELLQRDNTGTGAVPLPPDLARIVMEFVFWSDACQRQTKRPRRV